MDYKPKIIKGTIKGTGWPIDGHTLHFSLWDYDNYDSWHLYGWDDADDEAVMLTIWKTENEAGLSLDDTLEDFTKRWKAKKWEPQGAFCLDLDKVEVVEVVQEEVKNDTREKLRAQGFDLAPRKYTDKGAFGKMFLQKNLDFCKKVVFYERTPPVCLRRQPPRRWGLWQYGQLSGFAKGSLSEGAGIAQR